MPINRNASLDGVEIPFVQLIDAINGTIIVILDKRFATNISKEDAIDFVWFLANAIVIGMGWPSWDHYADFIKNPPQLASVVDNPPVEDKGVLQ